MADEKLGLNPYHIHVLEKLTEFDKQYVIFLHLASLLTLMVDLLTF